MNGSGWLAVKPVINSSLHFDPAQEPDKASKVTLREAESGHVYQSPGQAIDRIP